MKKNIEKNKIDKFLEETVILEETFLNKIEFKRYDIKHYYNMLMNLIKVKTFGDCKVKKVIIPLKPITLRMIAFHHRGK